MTTVVGIVGGIGSGKSAVSRAFKALGAKHLDADALAGEVLDEPQTLAILATAFGPEVLDEHGKVDRQALAARVFGPENSELLRQLNEVVHPLVRVRLGAGLASARAENRPVVVLDVPLLLESPCREDCDYVLFVKTDEKTRQSRVKARGWDANELRRRESCQLDLAEKETSADFVIVNEGSSKDLSDQVKELYDQLAEG